MMSALFNAPATNSKFYSISYSRYIFSAYSKGMTLLFSYSKGSKVNIKEEENRTKKNLTTVDKANTHKRVNEDEEEEKK